MEMLPQACEESGINISGNDNLKNQDKYQGQARMKLITVLAVCLAVALAVACVILATRPPKNQIVTIISPIQRNQTLFKSEVCGEQVSIDPVLVLNLKLYYKEKGANSIVGFGISQCLLFELLKEDGYEIAAIDYGVKSAPFIQKAQLGQAIFLNRRFDYALSLEIEKFMKWPQVNEEILIDNIARHTSKGLVISWAGKTEEQLRLNMKFRQFKYNAEATQKMRRYFNNAFSSSLLVYDKEKFVEGQTGYIVFPQSDHIPPNSDLVGILKQYYKEKNAKSIADFGCGECGVIAILKEDGYEVIGVDGTPYSNASYVQQKDLATEFFLGKTYDYVQSFEVGEHIYHQFEDNFIGNLVRHAKRGIFLSWALPAQKGFEHVNEHPNSYIIEKVEKHGFKYNKQVIEKYRQRFPDYHFYRRTLMLFEKV